MFGWSLPVQVFHPGCSQERVFEDTRHLVQSAVDGYNVCIFAYGQTGAFRCGMACACDNCCSPTRVVRDLGSKRREMLKILDNRRATSRSHSAPCSVPMQEFSSTQPSLQSWSIPLDNNLCHPGSGKTFTIYGSEKEPGLTPRGVAELFKVCGVL
jgi:hypothetical protein